RARTVAYATQCSSRPAEVLRSEGDDGSDRRLHERVRQRACELVDGLPARPPRGAHERGREGAWELVEGFPAGAVRRQDSAYFCGDESIDCRLDDRFEDAAREGEAADGRGEPLFAGQAV